MARIVLADRDLPFDGESPRKGPLGGVQTAVVGLAEALAARGHLVTVHNSITAPRDIAGVAWRPLAEGLPSEADLYIANRAGQLIGALPRARRSLFWIHNPARYLLKRRFLWPLLRHRPTIVFLGSYHLSTYPRWAPDGGRVVIPCGLSAEILAAPLPAEAPPPPPRAVFTSNPERGLDWLLDLWCREIRPRVPEARLELFVGAATYGGERAERMAPILARAAAASAAGVVLRAPLAKPELARELATARAMLYRGDPGETFCLAVAEAQALGVPAVIQPIGSLPERVIAGETGFIERDPSAFARRAVALLTEDDLWRRQHAAALEKQRGLTWERAAVAFEALLPAPL